MNRKIFKINRIIAMMLLTSVFTFAFVWTNSSASEQSSAGVQEQKPVAEIEGLKTVSEPKAIVDGEATEVVTLRAAKRGSPLINLQDGKRLRTKFIGAENETQSFNSSQARTMTNADLNADGASDLIVGYGGGGGGGHLALYQGNLDSLSARTPEIFEEMRQGNFPAPFLSEARLIRLPITPDFIGAGDFNRDGYKDIVAAERGDSRAFLLLGNSRGNYRLSYVELSGRVTAMLTENIDPLDNAADVAFAVSGESGASLLVYKGAADAFGENPDIYPFPVEATSLAFGQLDNSNPMDILAAVGGKVAIIHGSYPENESSKAGQVEILNQDFDAAAVRVGNFVWDRENRPEIALLNGDGSVRILERGKLDKRPFSEEELKMRMLKHRELMKQEEAVRKPDYKPRQAKRGLEKWTESDSFQLNATLESDRASSSSFFSSARMTPLGVEDLLVVDSASRKIHVLVSNNDELKKTGESFKLSASGKRAAVTFDVESTPAMAMPMKLSVMNRPGIVMLDKASPEISYSLAVPEATFSVNTTLDTYDGVCDANCSFRDALDDTNANINSDIIMLPAGTYTINPLLGGPDDDIFNDPLDQTSGDWDVFYDTTITGAGQATTILQAGATTATGHDRVLDALQFGVGIPDLTISGITIQNGRCRADIPCVDGGGLRYAVDAFAALTISDTTIINNRTEVDAANQANNGGGIFGGPADYNFTNVTVTNNIAGFATGGCANCGGEGGGAIIVGTNSTNPTSLTITNNNFTGNQARTATTFGGRGGALASSPNSVTITGGTFNNNTADIDGGAFRIFTATTISGATISNNSARQSGGGVWNDPLDNANNPLTNTFTDLTMKGNLADSNGAIGTGEVTRGDGGAIFHNRGTLNLNNPTLGGTGAGEANTAFNGGGIFSSIGVLSITNGSVSGNTAVGGKGGGIEHKGSSASTVSSVTINNNTGSGIHITGTSSLDAANNTITGNSGDGITKIGTGTGSHFNSNTIHSNGELGIDLSDNGVTPNDPIDVDSGPNNLQNFPVLNYVRRGDGVANVTLNSPNGKYRIQYYANTACDPSGHGEGESLKASQVVDIVSGNTLTFFSPALAFGTMEQITATATHDANGNNNFDDDGSTSEFSACRKVNTPPTIAAQATSRQQGSAVSNSQIATVTDSDQALNTLTVTVNGGASATVNGVTVSNIVVDASGNVTADVVANCMATNASFTLRVTDNATEFNEATLNVTVTANTPPTLGTYPNTTVNIGSGTTVTPDAAPSDNGSLSGATVTAAPAFSDTLSVDSITGVVTITNASPAGTYTVSVTFTDDCGANTTKTFQLTVNAPPTITGANISRQRGSASMNSQVATVSDADQSEDTLIVTVNGSSSATVNGVTVSNITVDASGNVTANVEATCSATDANFTLRVTDNAGAFNEAALYVNVTPNTPPTVGNYPNTNVASGGSTTVTPGAAPADNGSITSATASAPGFTGTFSVNSTTGAVTVTNANPPGNHTVTVSFTDICGATTSTAFTLSVNSPPTANPDSYSTNEDTPLNVAAPGVLGNDTDPDAGTTLTAVLVIGPNNAQSFTLNANGSFSYTPNLNFFGTDSFTYKAKDNSNAESAPVTVTITVDPVNDPPTVTVVAGGSCGDGGSNGTINLVVSDPDSPPGNATLSGSSSNTVIVPNSNIVFGGNGANRTMTITPVPVNQSTQNSTVTITVNDGQGGTSTTTVTAVVGGNGTQAITGTSGDDIIFGFNGGDTLNGGAGKDLLCGGNGSDNLYGGEGDDTLDGDSGSDNLYGEGGNDILIGGSSGDFFSGGPGTDTAIDFNPGEGDTTDGTLGSLREFAEVVENWAEE